MMKNICSVVLAFAILIEASAFSFADNPSVEDYDITNLNKTEEHFSELAEDIYAANIVPYFQEGEADAISVFESTPSPTITSFRFYQNSSSSDYIDLSATDVLTVDYNGSTEPYKFEITVDHPELISQMFITANAENDVRQMDAVFDNSSCKYIAVGFFDDENIFFQPDSIRLEYTPVGDVIPVGAELRWDEMTPYLGVLANAEVINSADGNTNSGVIDFSGMVEELGDLGLEYVITEIDSNLGTELGTLRSYYQDGENIISYIVPGLDDSKYYAYLDYSDPWTYRVFLDDGLEIASKAVELQLSFIDFIDEQNMINKKYVKLWDTFERIDGLSTLSQVIGEAHKISLETESLKQQIDASTTIEDKGEAYRKAEELQQDKLGFSLLTIALPKIVAVAGTMGGGPAMLFGAIIGVMTAASKTIYDYRISGILGVPEVETSWYDNIKCYEGQCGETAYYRLLEYGEIEDPFYTWGWGENNIREYRELQIYGSGSLYNSAFRNLSSNSNRFIDKVVISGISRISNDAFEDCKNIKELTLPETLEEIGDEAFANCVSIENVVLPYSIQKIGEYAFKGCSNLKSINIPNGVTEIPVETFSGCSNLTNVTFGRSIKTIGPRAFQGCVALNGIYLPEGLELIGAGAFDETSITELILPSSVEGMIDGFFSGGIAGSNLRSLVFSEGMTVIPYGIAKNTGVTHVQLPSTLIRIEGFAFNGCSNLAEIELPDDLEEIGDYAFEGCSNLAEIEFPDSLRLIGEHSFEATALESIRLPKSLEWVYEYAFFRTSINTVKIPKYVYGIGSNAFSWVQTVSDVESDVREMTVYFEGSLPNMLSNDIFVGRAVEAYYPIGDDSWSYKPDTKAYSINWHEHEYETVNLHAVLPRNLRTIEPEAFYKCGFTSVYIKEGCLEIGSKAFAKSYSLEEIHIPNSVVSIAPDAFDGIPGVLAIYGVRGSYAHGYSWMYDNIMFYEE